MIDNETEHLDRERRRAEVASRLGRRQVWFIDDPGLQEILESQGDLAVLEFVRSAGTPVSLAQIVAAGLTGGGASSDCLDRLEKVGLIEYVNDSSSAGYRCVDSIITIEYDGGDELHVAAMGRYRAGIRKHNHAVETAAGEDAVRQQIFDRILRLTNDELAKLDAAIVRIAAESRRAEEASATRRPEDDERGPVRLQLSVTRFGAPIRTLAPIYFMQLSHPYAERVMNSSIDRLTPRQREVATLIVAGEANRMIGSRLGISENTVKSLVREIYRRLEVDTRADLVRVLTD